MTIFLYCRFSLTLFYHTYIIQDFFANVQGVNTIFILFFNFSHIVNHYISDFAFLRGEYSAPRRAKRLLGREIPPGKEKKAIL